MNKQSTTTLLLLIVLSLVIAGLAHQSWQRWARVAQLDNDLATLRHANAGVFGLDTWIDYAAIVLDKQISQFLQSETHEKALKAGIAHTLRIIIDQVEEHQQNPQETNGIGEYLQSKLKGALISAVIDFDRLRADAPDIADDIIKSAREPENLDRIRSALAVFFKDALKTGSSAQEYLSLSLQQLNCGKFVPCVDRLEREMATTTEAANRVTLATFAAILLLMLLDQQSQRTRYPLRSELSVAMLVLSSMLCLGIGLVLPMITLKTILTEFTLTISNHSITFQNQYLFYQSKSIANIFFSMLETGDTKIVAIAILIVVFCVVFPACKVIAIARVMTMSAAQNLSAVTSWFALQSSKWSMADVFVVAIFMAFIGMDELIGLKAGELTEVLYTTSINKVQIENQSTIGAGFTFFLAFNVISFYVGARLKHNLKSRTVADVVSD